MSVVQFVQRSFFFKRGVQKLFLQIKTDNWVPKLFQMPVTVSIILINILQFRINDRHDCFALIGYFYPVCLTIFRILMAYDARVLLQILNRLYPEVKATKVE